MRGMALFLIIAAATFLGACGGAAAEPANQDGAGGGATPDAPRLKITPGTPRARAGETGQRVRPPSELEVTIDSCTWEPAEAGGPVELNLRFTVQNNAHESLFATYRVQNSTGTIFRPKGFDSSMTVYTGKSDGRTLHTGKFEVGAGDLELVIAGQRRTTHIVPIDQCTQP